MKKLLSVLIIVVTLLAVFTGCKEAEVVYKDPFNGKIFYQNMGTNSEKALSFKDGELTLYYWDEFLNIGDETSGTCTYEDKIIEADPDGDGPCVATTERVYSKNLKLWKKTVSETFSYTFDGASKQMVLTPKKVFLPTVKTIYIKETEGQVAGKGTVEWELEVSGKDYTGYEEHYIYSTGDLLSYDDYLAELKKRFPEEEYNESIAKILFNPITYKYEFNAIYGTNSPYWLSLVTEDENAFFQSFLLTNVFSN